MRGALVAVTVIVLSSLSASCSEEAAELMAVQQQPSGTYTLTLMSEGGVLRERSNRLVLEVADTSTSQLVGVNNLQIQATMPMPGMAPMFGDVSSPVEVEPGRYQFTADLTMVGGWSFIVTFDPDVRVQFNLRAQ